jgi:phosphomannomutase
LIVRPSGTEPKVKVYMEAINNIDLIEEYKTMIAEAIDSL